MIKSILPALLLAIGTPVLATPPGGSWYRDNYYPAAESATLCEAVLVELETGVDEGLFSPEYAQEVYDNCLRWAER